MGERGTDVFRAVATGLILGAVVACGAAAGDASEEARVVGDEDRSNGAAADDGVRAELRGDDDPSNGAAMSPKQVVAALEENPPSRLNDEQFELLLGHYCVSCHVAPACADACDGFWFDDWADLAEPDGDIEYRVGKVVLRMSDETMPPIALPLSPTTRQLMIDFIRSRVPSLP
jgi:hypothetical protein